MIKNSTIEWTGLTYNPWQGCTKKTIEIGGQAKLREECRNCYMYRDKKRYGQRPEFVVRSAPATFNKPLKAQKEVEQGFRPSLQDRLVFTCSWSDWNNPEADEWRPEAWGIVRRCPDLIFQILTKLPQRMNDHLPSFWDEIKERCWVGVTAGYQEAADEMRPYLSRIDAPHRFVSYEPALGPVNWEGWQGVIDWLICGGESGQGARPTHPDWARQARDWAVSNGIAYHFKQWGEWLPVDEFQGRQAYCRVDPTGKWKTSNSYSGQLMAANAILRDKDWQLMARVGKQAAGRLLDGRSWDGFPSTEPRLE